MAAPPPTTTFNGDDFDIDRELAIEREILASSSSSSVASSSSQYDDEVKDETSELKQVPVEQEEIVELELVDDF